MTFIGKLMSLLFNMLSRLVSFSSKEQVSFNLASVAICSDVGAQKIKSDTVSPSICHEVMGRDGMIYVF